MHRLTDQRPLLSDFSPANQTHVSLLCMHNTHAVVRKTPKVNCEVTTDSYRLLNHPHPAEHLKKREQRESSEQATS